MDRQGVYSSSWPIAEASEDQQQLMVSTPQLCTHRKTVASLKVFTIVMLHSWRQRRKEVRELQDMVQRLQDNSMKTKNQLHVYGTLVRVEEKRNRELQIKLKQSTMSIDQVRSSCESLVNSVRDLTTEKIRLQTDLDQRSQKYDDLEKMSNNTKRLLSTAYMEQSYLQKQLISEQRIRRKLQEEKEQLIQEVVLAESREAKYRQVRDWYQHQLDEKKECIHIMRRRMALLEEKLRDIKDRTGELDQMRESAQQMSNEITELRQEINQSRTSFFSVLGDSSSRQSLKRLQGHMISSFQRNETWTKLRRCTFNVMYLICLYLLPGMPVNHHKK
ncbi:myosin heavy chain isoform X1 [Drosophila yakuba]|uniref:Uncharacterized protein, isoform A n=1 Tax=Drosophila yakuba TaxID=7245 RepID=B4P8R7_DROYA|nr:myosin heavy chain isoform X1 [Drosophila yakuba]XP_039229078.1 myosin heavy chain isoform X1 [Drosophila yakuba]EDW90175.1 uncharacterized protein Dyak_GE12793, isoform A [Drosophila yakuba]